MIFTGTENMKVFPLKETQTYDIHGNREHEGFSP